MRPSSAMLPFFLSFAHIGAQEIPEGIMPKRQVIGTGVTTSTSATEDPEPTTETTSDDTPTTTSDPEETTSEPTTESTSDPTTESTSDPTSAPPDPTTSDDTPDTTSSDDVEQTSDTTSDDNEQTTTTSTTSASPSSQTAVTTTDSAGSTITSSVSAPSQTLSSSGAVRTSSGSDSSDAFVVIGSSTIFPSTLSSATTITSEFVRESTEPFTSTSFWTSDGTLLSRIVTGDRVVSSTELATATVDPTLAGGSGGSGSGGMSNSTKAIIGGVVGGVGGALLIGALALVGWRLWGKKKRQQAEMQEDSFGGSTANTASPMGSFRREKGLHSSGSHAPSASVDSYRNPNGAVNTASNF